MDGTGRGRGLGGRIIDEMDMNMDCDSTASFKTDEEKSKSLKKENPPLFQVGRGGCIGRGVGKNVSPVVAEMVGKVQLELFDREYYLQIYQSNANAPQDDVQDQARSVVAEVPAPPPAEEEEEMDYEGKERGDDDDMNLTSNPHRPNRESQEYSEIDSEVEELKVHLKKKKKDQRKLERVRHEQVWKLKQVTFGNQMDSDEDSEGADLGRKRKSREKILKVMRKMRKESNGEDKNYKKRPCHKNDKTPNKRLDKGETKDGK